MSNISITRRGPSYAQKILVSALAKLGEASNIFRVGEDLGFSQARISYWIKDPEFIDYLNQNLGVVSEAYRSRVMAQLFKQIDSGNMKAIELYFKLRGDLKLVPQTATQNNIFISDDKIVEKYKELGMKLPDKILAQVEDASNKIKS